MSDTAVCCINTGMWGTVEAHTAWGAVGTVW